MEETQPQDRAEEQEGTETKPQMSLDELIAQAQEAGKEKEVAIAKRGDGTAKKKKEPGPRKVTTAEAFAKALELIQGNAEEPVFVTVKGVTAIMEHQGWTSESRTEREKYIAVKSAIYNRKRAGDQSPKMALPIDWSKSRDGLFAYKPIVDQDEAEGAETGDTDTKPEDIPTE